MSQGGELCANPAEFGEKRTWVDWLRKNLGFAQAFTDIRVSGVHHELHAGLTFPDLVENAMHAANRMVEKNRIDLLLFFRNR